MFEQLLLARFNECFEAFAISVVGSNGDCQGVEQEKSVV